MANRNNDKDQPPPNPFLLSSSSTFPVPAPASSLFTRPPGAGEGAGLAPLPSTTTTTTAVATTAGPFGLAATTEVPAMPFASRLYAAAASTSSIFGNAPVRAATTPATLFGNPKRSVGAAAGSLPAGEGEVVADLASPPAPGPSMASVFGGVAGRPGGGFGGAAAMTAASKVLRGGEAASTVFGRRAGAGAEGQASSFGQLAAPATSVRADLFKDASTPGLTPSAMRAFRGQPECSVPSTAAKKSVALLTGKASTSSGSPKGKARAARELLASPGRASKGQGRKEGEGPSPEHSRKEVTKILVTNIPDNCMNRDFLRSHFSKFGEVKRLMPNSQTRQATVIYTTHHGASRAKHKGRKLHPMLPEVKIYYAFPARRRSEEAGLEAAQAKKKAIRTLQQVHQPSDLDPYTPLQRPDAEPAATATAAATPKKAARARVSRPSQPKAGTQRSRVAAVQKLPVPAAPKKKVRSKSPAREAREAATVTADEGNLAAVLEVAAQNNNDRYNILKARDKLLRRERHRTSDLQEASYLAATCPDMCPELERYMRDVQNDLSTTFETSGGVLDHRLVTKKFSRSSADKELPLPHELRPGPVLLRTLDFLVCNVISRVEENGMEVDVWYNYLWNRTRAVRNDLMQQQLTDAMAVAIMERCVRFHIYAAARLCEEPPDLFDAKMNTEHLTKSLQTLRELYHDLGEQGQRFPSEAEFRAYEMLLSLNDGEAIVNKYSKFTEEVQKSGPVQFALRVIQAVTFNNYVKFFRLVRSAATYLQGCLLHRYFRQVRSRALETIIRAYVSPKGPQTIPLQTLTHILGFESQTEAAAYLQCHGIRTTDDTTVLDRHSYVQRPEEAPPLVRPLLLVERNRLASVEEVIQGGPVPPNPLHTHVPHDSFDAQGRLKPGARDATDQSGGLAGVPLGLGLAPVVQQSEAMQNYALVAHMKDIYSAVEGAVLPPMVREVSVEVVEVARRDAAAHSVAADLLAEAVWQEAEAVGREAYSRVEREEAERRRRKWEEEERQRKALEEVRRAVAEALHSECLDQAVAACVWGVCEEAVQEATEEAALQELEQELPRQCLEEVVAEEVAALAREAMQELAAEQQRRVEAFAQRLALRSMAEHFQVWRLQTQKAHRRKQSQMTFPAACSGLSLGQQSRALGWGHARDPQLNMSALQVAQLEGEVGRVLRKLTVKNQLARECAWHPLALRHQVAALVAREPPGRHSLLAQYFKVLVCPSEAVRPEVMLWLRSKLGGQGGGLDAGCGAGQEAGQDILQPLDSSFNFMSRRSGLEYAWAMREVDAAALMPADLQGAALVLLVSSRGTAAGASRGRVRGLLREAPHVSLCEIKFEGAGGGGDEGGEGEWPLVEEDLVKPCTSDRLQALLLGAWQRQGRGLCLAASRLNDLATDMVLRRFLGPALRRQGQCLADGKAPPPPYALVDLYNSTLDGLLRAVADDELAALSWPPPELAHLAQVPPPTWNSEDMQRAARLLGNMRLPQPRVAGPPTTWAGLAQDLHRYAAAVSSGGGEAPVLASHMDAILAEAWESLGPCLCPEEEGESEGLELDPILAPWPQIIYACASYKLSGLPDAQVYYQPHTLDNFLAPESWLAACSASGPPLVVALWTEHGGTHAHTGTSRKRKAQGEEEQEAGKVTRARTVHSQLLEDIATERRKCQEFEESLKGMLEVEEELKVLFNTSY
ncbi:germinal-center associated nuclear protein-like isoform X2 [Eriocheir sinensis]|nr:germinal-center associated nuclear protein-like isoform X2 [Eriocheir sinensis]XP_050713563.1 germinal-center associated nuclear protein-like isoform X2 [Eriocheir sinensis]XP_050713564.1 germinal-center associated nuclear protein-like isoform X2 [Eriocheir sinensis]